MDADGRLKGNEIGADVWTEAQARKASEFSTGYAGGVSMLDGTFDGGAYLLGLAEAPGLRSQFADDVSKLADLAHKRITAERVARIASMLDEPGYDPTADVADLSSTGLCGGEWVGLDEIAPPSDEQMAAEWGVSESGCTTSINAVIPLMGGRMTVLAAKPGGGKTTMAVQVLAANAKAGRKCAFISMEMSRSDCWRFFWKHDIPQDCLSNIRIMDSGHLTPEALGGAVRTACGWGADIIVVDHIAYVREAPGQKQHEAISSAARRLVETIKREKASLLCLAQMTREGRQESRSGADTQERPPSLADLRGSADIEQGAAGVCFLWCPPDAQPDSQTEQQHKRVVRMKIAKNRFGPLCNVDLDFWLKRGILSREKHAPAELPLRHERLDSAPDDSEDLFR